MGRARLVQFVACAIAIVSLGGAAAMQKPLERFRIEHDLIVPGSISTEGRAELNLLTIAPGGLRAPIVNWLWITTQKLKDEGRIFDARQRAQLICRFQPRFPAVWDFQAWNMAWNISVATHTPDERWLWVTEGMELLRDEGIPYNPKSLMLYKNLAWIFFSKMHGTTDLMHLTYKRRWAIEMQHLLAAPPYGSTEEAIEAFRPIAEVPLDKNPHRPRGWGTIQDDKRKELLKDPSVAQLAKLFTAHDVRIDDSLLVEYNRYSRDDSAEIYRAYPPAIETERDKALSELINSPKYTAPLSKLLGFVRSQILWGWYRLDPQWMLQLMEKYGPIDWRLPEGHALYWATFGLHACKSLNLSDIDSLNTDRIVLYALKDMMFRGRLTLIRDPSQPDFVQYIVVSDPRFVETTHREYLNLIEVMAGDKETAYEESLLRDGHIGFLTYAIESMYALGNKKRAQHYFDWMRSTYKLGRRKDFPQDVGDFVFTRIVQSGVPIPGMVVSQITLSLAAGYVNLALNNRDAFDTSRSYARFVHRIFHEGRTAKEKGAPERNRLPPFVQMEQDVVKSLLVRPQIFGFRLDLMDRSGLYQRLPPATQLNIYDWIEPALRKQCEDSKFDFARSFPPPPGLEQFRRSRPREPVPLGG